MQEMNIDQFFRFLWLHGVEWVGDRHLAYVLMGLMALGAVVYSGMLRPRSCPMPRDGYIAAVVVGLTLTAGIVLLAVVPTSPLLSISGGIAGSPWLAGLYPISTVTVVIVSMVYGLVSGVLSSWLDVVELLCYGFRRWPWLILVGMVW